MSEQDGIKVSTFRQPTTNDDKEAWKAYWKALDQPWRTEPEIDVDRQKFLTERRGITPSIEWGIYPFKGIEPKLTRADIEWLLATHENGLGPVDWNDQSQRNREGLDLRGAILNEENLSELPLARLLGGIGSRRQVTPTSELIFTTTEQRDMAAVRMEGANLENAHLERANLSRSRLNKANIRRAHLESADLFYAHLEEAFLSHAHLEGAFLLGCHLEGTILFKAHLAGALLLRAIFNHETNLEGILLWDEKHGYASLADIRWGDANLTVVNWSQVKLLGDEYRLQHSTYDGKTKDRKSQIKEYETAIRANRQLAVELQDQGLNEVAVRFVYRAQLMQRKVFWYQGKLGQYLFSLFLDLLSGYGYKPGRCFIAYLLVILSFATVYFIIGHKVGPVLSPLGSVVFSMTSFHGRGFFPGGIGLDDPLTVVAALEAFVGLLIEVTFIATLTQRLFGK